MNVRLNDAQRQTSAVSITADIVTRARDIAFEDLPDTVRDMARLCLMDWLGVALGGVEDPVSRILADQVAWDGGRPEATVIGREARAPAARAALANGTMSHALDYDDVHRAMNGHPTAPVLPAALALAEAVDASGLDFMTAFVAGYEAECRVGALVFPDHYRRGFHATATIGSFGAATAAARVLGLGFDQTLMAFGIAGTQAAGLKSMFGTMCKPFHAGKAAENGVMAARLAAAGMTSNADVLGSRDGFALTHSSVFSPEAAQAEPAGGFHILSNLFKYHASCYRTHASIEAALQLREKHQLNAADINRVVVHINEDADRICNIAQPSSGLELKFSLRATAALALMGADMAAIGTYSDAMAANAGLIALRDRTTVDLQTGMTANHSIVDVTLVDGTQLSAEYNVGIPEADRAVLRRRLEAKFLQLVAPLYGSDAAQALMAMTQRVDTLKNVHELTALCGPGRPDTSEITQ